MTFHARKDVSHREKEHRLRAELAHTTWVCERWREVALRTPAFWSSVLISWWGAHNSTLLLNITYLHFNGIIESFSRKANRPWTCVHRFLAACPNLETFRSVYSFEYPLEYLSPHNDQKDLPVVILPKLRPLSVEGLALDMSLALGVLLHAAPPRPVCVRGHPALWCLPLRL